MKKFLLMSVVFVMVAAFAQAEPSDVLTPLLTDLNGWKAQKANGMSMNMAGMNMLSATREYSKDGKTVSALIMKGNAAMLMGGAQGMQTMSTETEDAIMNIKTINGFKVQTVYDKKDGSGVISVFLTSGRSTGASFSFNYSGISQKEALRLSKKFDWNKMKSVVGSLK